MTDVEATDQQAEPDPPAARSTRGATWVVAGAVVVIAAVAVGWFVLGRGGGGTPRITAGDAVIGATNASAAAAYVQLENSGSGDDRLVRVTSPVVGDVSLHSTVTKDGLSTMTSIDGLDIPAGSSVSLSPGGSHLMLDAATAPLRVGDKVPLHLEFEHAPALDVQAEVVPLADLADRVGR